MSSDQAKDMEIIRLRKIIEAYNTTGCKDADAMAEKYLEMANEKARLSSRFETLYSLRLLKPSWDSYGAEPISEQAIQSAKYIFNSGVPVPTSDGGIQLEWHTQDIDIEINIRPDGTAKFFNES